MPRSTAKSAIQQYPRRWLGYLAVGALIVYGVYSGFFRVSDEIGYAGAGKAGRQVLIQTFDEYLKPNINVESEFYDYSFLYRLFVGEPRRTILRFDIQDTNEFKASPEAAQAFLNQPFGNLLDQFSGSIFMQEGYEVPVDQLRKTLQEHNASTVADLLAGFGFKRFDLYERSQYRYSTEIPNVRNVLHAGF